VLGKSAIVAFVTTREPDRARAFYESVLGLRLVADEPFGPVVDAHGTTLRVQPVQELTPARQAVLGRLVPAIAAAVRSASTGGVAFERFPGLPQDDLGVCTSPGGGRVAWFKDPDANTLSLTEGGA
jgi:catechol 2,3-dioxygenase-like lactoylglutathione lyase family enzyme